MLRIKPLFILCAALLTVTPAASADVNSDMNQFFNKLGFASNTTQPGVWQGQAAGYAYGGSLYARTQVKNVQLISMTLPDINAGCGGIDAYLGSFSFINGEQLQRFVKQIMSNAAGYFFDLALQTTVPEIKTAKDFLQKMASDINSMNLSSCQAAQGIIGGLFPRTQVSQQKVCQDIAGESNIFADWAASRQGGPFSSSVGSGRAPGFPACPVPEGKGAGVRLSPGRGAAGAGTASCPATRPVPPSPACPACRRGGHGLHLQSAVALPWQLS